MTFRTTAQRRENTDRYEHFGVTPLTARAFYNNTPIYGVTLTLALDQEVVEPAEEKTRFPGHYWGWVDAEGQLTAMIFPNRLLLSVCFTYGLEAAERGGAGKAYRFALQADESPLPPGV